MRSCGRLKFHNCTPLIMRSTIPKKKPFGEAIGVLKPNAQNIQAFVLSKPLQQFQKKKLCKMIKTFKYSLRLIPKYAPQIEDGGRPLS